MEIRWLKRKEEDVESKFYPITHVKAIVMGDEDKTIFDHFVNTENPHKVTAEQVGAVPTDNLANLVQNLIDSGVIDVSAIKNVQRGVTKLPSDTSTIDVTISEVDMTKAFVNIQPYQGNNENMNYVSPECGAFGRLKNSTTLNLTGYNNGYYIAWEVIEFK